MVIFLHQLITKTKQMKQPTLDEFVEHGKSRLQILGKNPEEYTTSLVAKFLAWTDNNWKTGNNREIKNWKSTLTNTLVYLKPEPPMAPKTINRQTEEVIRKNSEPIDVNFIDQIRKIQKNQT